MRGKGDSVPVGPEEVSTWGEVIGGAVAGVLGLRGLQVLRARGDETTLEDLIQAVHEDGEATRKILRDELGRMNEHVAILLDRAAHARP